MTSILFRWALDDDDDQLSISCQSVVNQPSISWSCVYHKWLLCIIQRTDKGRFEVTGASVHTLLTGLLQRCLGSNFDSQANRLHSVQNSVGRGFFGVKTKLHVRIKRCVSHAVRAWYWNVYSTCISYSACFEHHLIHCSDLHNSPHFARIIRWR